FAVTSAASEAPTTPEPPPLNTPVVSLAEVPSVSDSTQGFRDLAPPELSTPPAPPFAAAATAAGSDPGIAAFGSPKPFGLAQPEESPAAFTHPAHFQKNPPEMLPVENAFAVSAVAAAENNATTLSGSDAQREAEISAATAAAWASWRDIRESLVNAKASAENLEPAQTASHPDHGEEPAAEIELIKQLKGMKPDLKSSSIASDPNSGSTHSPATSCENPNEIASIVDSMLAELRPKLVAEIAKKLGKKDE